jgi:hypothetical protein
VENPEKASGVQKAMIQMGKLDVAELRRCTIGVRGRVLHMEVYEKLLWLEATPPFKVVFANSLFKSRW